MTRRPFFLGLIIAAACASIAAPARAQTPSVVEIELTGTVDPLAARYVERGLEHARETGAPAVLIRIDTPGGLASSMRTIVTAIQGAKVNVVCWVGPSGARAASAGAIVMLGCPYATMAPGTNVGAAHPVGFRGEVLDSKITNDAAAQARALAQSRGRNADVAERMVRDSLSLSAEDALEQDVIDIVVADEAAVLRFLEVATHGDPQISGARIERFDMTVMESLLHHAIDPNLAFLLLVVGLLGLLSELLHPGITVGGVFGSLSLIGALVILGMLPVNIAGVLLILTGIALMAAEVYLPGGVVGALGLVSLVLGGLFLFDASIPSAQVSRGLLIGIVLAVIAFFLTVVRAVMRTRRQPRAAATTEDLVGEIGVVERALDPVGIVRARNESWTARATGDPLVVGTPVRVRKVDGLTLEVEVVVEQEPSGIDAQGGAK